MKNICVLLLTLFAAGCGSYTNSMGVGAAPTITQLMPNMTAMPAQAFMLTVVGNNFTSGSVVYWGMTPKTTTLLNAGQLVVQIAPSDTACGMTPCTVQFVQAAGPTAEVLIRTAYLSP